MSLQVGPPPPPPPPPNPQPHRDLDLTWPFYSTGSPHLVGAAAGSGAWGRVGGTGTAFEQNKRGEGDTEAGHGGQEARQGQCGANGRDKLDRVHHRITALDLRPV